jgi:hypothetical protein
MTATDVGAVYVLHFAEPFHGANGRHIGARHYVGFAADGDAILARFRLSAVERRATCASSRMVLWVNGDQTCRKVAIPTFRHRDSPAHGVVATSEGEGLRVHLT